MSTDLLPVSDGTSRLLDERELQKLKHDRWYATSAGGFAFRIVRDPGTGRRTRELLHRIVAGVRDRTQVVRFRDGDPHNCTHTNLEVISRSRLQQERVPAKTAGSSLYRGVSWYGKRQMWQAVIRVEGTLRFLGYFPPGPEGEEEAARAYDTAARLHRGPDAHLNFPPAAPRPKPKRRIVRRPGEVQVQQLYQKPVGELSPEEIARMRAQFFRSG